MPAKNIDSFDVYEFRAVVGQDGGDFIAVGYNADQVEVCRFRSNNLDDVRLEIRRELTSKSENYVGYEGAIKLFLRAYPAGFADPFFLHDERNYKEKAHRKAQDLLAKARIDSLIENGQYSKVAEAAKSVFINLVFPNEAMAFAAFANTPDRSEVFAKAFREMLHGDDFNGAFDKLSTLLGPAAAAKWTVLTYWPFILFPDRHMFLKPEVAKEAASRLGEVFDYESRPSARVYQCYLSFTARLRDHIGELTPRDNIDVQTFMYAVGKRGFVTQAEKRRAAWEKSP